MKKALFYIVVTLLLCLFTVGTTLAAEPVEGFVYYDTAGVTYGSFSLPETYDQHLFYGVVTDETRATVATFESDAFTVSFDATGTSLTLTSFERWEEGNYTFTLTVKNPQTNSELYHTFSFVYTIMRPTPVVSKLPSGQGQYRLFFENFLLSDDVQLEVAMLNETQKMVATTYLDFSSDNLVGNMLTKYPSEIEGYSFVEMVTLFKTAPITTENYQLYFSIDEKLITYQDVCQLEVVDSPIVQEIIPILSDDLLYGENRLQPMIAGSAGFDVVITGFQIDPRRLTANLYDQSGGRVARSVSYLYHDTLTLGYGAINGYQRETGIQALALHMETLPSAVLKEGETYRVVLSYDDSPFFGVKEYVCIPETELFVSSAEPFDIGAITLNIVNFSDTAVYDVMLYDDTYGELYCGTTEIPEDGILELNAGSPLTSGQGVLLGSDGSTAQFFYKNELIGLFIPQEIKANPVVLHPTTTSFVAHFTMNNYSIFENASIEVRLIKFAQQQGGEYVGVDEPYAVAVSTETQSIVRSKQDGYYNTDVLVEMSVTDALDESGLYTYVLNINGHEISLIDQGEAYIVQVVNNTVYQADILDRTLYGGIPVLQSELYFWCGGVVVRDPARLNSYLVDEAGQVVASMVPGSLTPLTMESEQQFCGKLHVDSPMQPGTAYYLIVQYGNETLFVSSEYIGDDSQNSTVLIQQDIDFSPGTNEVIVFSQLVNIPVEDISFEIVDFLQPYETVKVLATRTAYNFDTYYQWRHSLILDTSLHEGVYKVILNHHGEPLADAMICVSTTPRIFDIQPDFDGVSIGGYWITLENAEVGESYGVLFGRNTAFSEAISISEKQLTDGKIYLSKAELTDLAVGTYEVLLTKNNIPISGYSFYLTPFSTPLEIVDSNIFSGELERNESAISFTFSQPLNINTVSTETVQLFDADGLIQPISVSVSPDRYTLSVQPQTLLREEAQYTLLLTTSLQAIYYGRMDADVEFGFFIRASEQSKTDFFITADEAIEIRDDELYAVSFLEGSLESDALLGIWADDVAIDLSCYVGLLQSSPIIEITDYKDDAAFKRAVSLAIFNREMPTPGQSFVLLRYDPKTGVFEQESTGAFLDGVVYTTINSCGRYVLCLADTMPFEDVAGTWAANYVEELWHYQIISGYNATTFGPDLPITRSEFVKMLVSALQLPLLDTKEYNLSLFRDFNQIEEWALPYWATAYQLNIIRGTSQNALSPNDYVTRAEIVTMIGRARLFTTFSETVFTDDSEIPAWSKTYFAGAIDAGILSGYPDGSIRPNAYASRAETAKMISKLIHFD